MSSFTTRNLLRGAAPLALLALIPQMALAQDTPPAEDDDDVIVITGQRSSIINSLEEKKDAVSVTDVLSADQLGRFPDPNVAEALARLPGVSFQRENDTGQGEFISIRGMDAAYNTVLFDGLRTGTADTFRRTALDIVTANNVSSIRVTKAPMAQDASEGIGGVVDIRTRGPLERSERAFLNFDVRDNTFDDDNGYRVSGGVSRKFSDDFAINLSAAFRETHLNTIYVNPASFTLEQINAIELTAADGSTAVFIDEDELNLVPQGFLNTSDFTNEQINFEDNDITRENLNIAGAIDWQVSDNTLLTFAGRYTQDDTTQIVSNIEFDADNGDIACASGEIDPEDVDPFARTACTEFSPSTFPDPEVTFEGQVEDSEEIQERYFARGTTDLDRWSFEYTAGYSRAFEDEPVLSIDFTNDFDDVPGGSDDNAVTFVPLNFGNAPFAFPDPQDLAVFQLGIDPYCENPDESSGRCGEINDFDEDIEDSRENTRYALKFDGIYDGFQQGNLDNIKFGLQFEQSEYDELRIDISSVDDSLGPNGEFLGIDQSGAFGGSLGDNNAVVGDLGLFLGDVATFGRIDDPFADIGFFGIPILDGDRLREIRGTFRDGFYASGSDPLAVERLQSEEDFYTGYAQGQWNFGNWDVIGGVRVEQYEGEFRAPLTFDSSLIFAIGGTGDSIDLAPNAGIGQSVRTTDNFEVLPRIAANWNMSENSILRLSYTTALARPTFDQLAASEDGNFSIELNDGVDPATATFDDVAEVSLNYDLGNPDLDNAYSHNFDISAEWYFDDANAFALAVFYKEIDNFIFNTFALEGDLGAIGQDFDPLAAVSTAPFSTEGEAFINQLGGLDALVGIADTRVRAPANGDKATVLGAEMSFFHTFDYLEGLWANFGIAGNLTWQETETDIDLGVLEADDALVVLGLANEGDTLTQSFDFFNSPDLTGNVGLFYDSRNLEASLGYRYAGRQLEEISSFGFAQYVQDRGFVDFDIEYTFRDIGNVDRTTLFFSANDILDDGTEPTTYETNDIDGDLPNFASFNGRSYRAGLRFSF